MGRTYLDLEVLGYAIKAVQSVVWTEKINEHSCLQVTALLDDAVGDSQLYDTKAGTSIALKQTGETEEILFQGMVTEIAIQYQKGQYLLLLEARSYTYILDIVKKRRSFQDVSMTYEMLWKKMMEEYSGGTVTDKATEGKTLGQFTVQYEETDWQFLQRMASRFHRGLVADNVLEGPKCTIGVPEGTDRGVLEQYHYRIQKEIGRYLQSIGNGNLEIEELDTVSFILESDENFKLGDTVTFHEVKLFVKEKQAVMNNGKLRYVYTLSSQKGMFQDCFYQKKIQGLSLLGQVIEVVGDMVKVQLETDEETITKEKACLFPYTTPYTAEGSTGWYCMPEVGDWILVYFPSEKEQDAMGIQSMRMGATGTDFIGDPNVKYFRTKNGKELMFHPEQIVITCCETEEDSIYICLHEEKGIQIVSTQPILLKSDGDITLEAEEQISLGAKEEIVLQCKTSRITINDAVDLAGKEVKIN